VCDAGIEVCKGDVQPGVELCNGEDDDCDGVADSPEPCPEGSACIEGTCAPACSTGEFRCPFGFECEDGYCIPSSSGGGSGSGGNTSGGSSAVGTGGAIVVGGTTGSGTGATGADTGTGGDGQGDAGETSSSAGSESVSGKSDRYGLATGGGGCGCRTSPQPGRPWLALVGVLLTGLVWRRRRAANGGAL
jgi:MYXO-CTERM domain-containing protein